MKIFEKNQLFADIYLHNCWLRTNSDVYVFQNDTNYQQQTIAHVCHRWLSIHCLSLSNIHVILQTLRPFQSQIISALQWSFTKQSMTIIKRQRLENYFNSVFVKPSKSELTLLSLTKTFAAFYNKTFQP